MDIKRKIKECGFTMMEVAELMGVSQSSFSHLVKASANPSINSLRKIADVIGIKLSELVADDIEPESELNDNTNTVDIDLSDIPVSGLRVRELMSRKRITPAELSKRVRVSVSAINALMDGNGNPALSTLNRLAWGIGVNVYDLFDKGDGYAPVASDSEHIALACPYCHAEIKLGVIPPGHTECETED